MTGSNYRNSDNSGPGTSMALDYRRQGIVASVPAQNSWAMSGRDLLHVIFRRCRLVTSVAIGVMVLCLIAAVVLPNKYRSEARLYLRVGATSIKADPTARMGAAITLMQTRDKEINSELELLKNRRIHERVISTMGPLRVLGYDVPRPKKPVEVTDADFESAVSKLERAISIESIPDTVMLSVSVEAKNKELARELTTEYVNAYLVERASTFQAAGSDVFLEKQLTTTRARIDAIEAELRALQEKSGVTSPEIQRGNLLARIDNFQKDIDATQSSLVTNEASIDAIRARLKEIPERVVTGSAMDSVDKLRATLGELKLKENDLSSRYKDDFPDLVSIRGQIVETQKMIADAEAGKNTTLSRNPTWDGLNQRMEQEIASRDSFKARIASLTKEKAEAEKGLTLINDTDVKIRDLLRERTSAEDACRKYAESLEQARNDKDLGESGIGNVSIAQPPTLPLKPVSPNRPLILVFGLFASLALAIGLALLVDAVDHTVHRPEDLAKVGVMRCVSIPYVEDYADVAGDVPMLRPTRNKETEHKASAWQNATRGLKSATRSTLRLVGLPGPAPEIANVPASIVVGRRTNLGGAQQTTRESPDAIRLRSARRHVAISDPLLVAGHSIFERLLGNFPGVKTIAVVGGQPGEGSSAVALHTATAVALRLEANMAGASTGDGLLRDAKDQVIGKAELVENCDRVLLIDANIHDASLHKMTSQTRSPGLGNWLSLSSNEPSELSQYVRTTAIANLDILTAGAPQDADMLSVRFSTLISLVKTHYRFVLIDMPPLWTNESTARLSGLCHGVLLVAEADRVRTEAAQQAITRIEEAGGKLLGVVLNKRRYPVPNWIYSRS